MVVFNVVPVSFSSQSESCHLSVITPVYITPPMPAVSGRDAIILLLTGLPRDSLVFLSDTRVNGLGVAGGWYGEAHACMYWFIFEACAFLNFSKVSSSVVHARRFFISLSQCISSWWMYLQPSVLFHCAMAPPWSSRARSTFPSKPSSPTPPPHFSKPKDSFHPQHTSAKPSASCDAFNISWHALLGPLM